MHDLFLLEDFALEQNFRTTHAMLVLYMWLSLCRLRAEGRDGGAMGQSLYDAFNHDLERRIIATGVSYSSLVHSPQAYESALGCSTTGFSFVNSF